MSNSNLVENFIDEHQVVPPSYQHATGENFGYSSCHSVSPLPLSENSSSCHTPSTPPVEIPPKKRNFIQGENVCMSASLGKFCEFLLNSHNKRLSKKNGRILHTN